MSSVIRSILGATLLLAGASAASAQTAVNPVVANRTAPTGATAATVTPNTAPAASQPVQGVAPAPAGAAHNAAAADPSRKGQHSNVTDNTDRYGGYDPNSTAGSRAFWAAQNPY